VACLNESDTGNEDEEVRVQDSQEVAQVRQAQRGDRNAFAALVRSYQTRVVSVAYRLLGNADDARDVGQDAFVKAFTGIGKLEDPARFGPWLLRIVGNLALNFRRSRSLRHMPSIDAARDADEGRESKIQPRAKEGNGESGPLSEELHAAVSAAMERLPEKQRMALILFSVEGMAQKDVADILECSVELVKWNVFQARKKLKELLSEYL
jgi:RNA polymerase sigma-70 factor (ECF subfamily)